MDNIDNPWGRRKEWEEQSHYGTLHILTSSLEKFSCTFLLHSLQSAGSSPEDVTVDSLHKLILELLQLGILLGPVPGGCGNIDRVNILVVLGKGVDGVGRELEGNLMLRDHVDVDHISFDVNDLVVEDGLNKRVGVPAQFGIGGLGDHYRAQGPDGIGTGECFCEAARVLLNAVEGTFDTVCALQRLG